jgi:hypothetical protein
MEVETRKHKKFSSTDSSSSVNIQFLPALAPPSKKSKPSLPPSKLQIVAPGEPITTEVHIQLKKQKW